MQENPNAKRDDIKYQAEDNIKCSGKICKISQQEIINAEGDTIKFWRGEDIYCCGRWYEILWWEQYQMLREMVFSIEGE